MSLSFILSFHCPDRSGIQSKVSSLLYNNDAFLTDVQSYSDKDAHTFFSRLVFSVSSEEAINKINKEGVLRLKEAFKIVNENFERLFTKLFGGGKAYLKLIQNDEDPLNSGLEIFASPPGKKMQNITLLSGGEQALTAISLLFAVFIANPSPFCILDEVDAPLDDNNVDRFCSMVEEISEKVQTKFIIVTHNRMTMSRVDRLYGVTMPEEGISQIVSVELEEAVKYAE